MALSFIAQKRGADGRLVNLFLRSEGYLYIKANDDSVYRNGAAAYVVQVDGSDAYDSLEPQQSFPATEQGLADATAYLATLSVEE